MMPYKNIEEKRANDRRYWLKIRGQGPAPSQLQIGTVQHLEDIKVPKNGLKIAYIPDVQALPRSFRGARGVSTTHLVAAGKYIAAKRPDVIVCAGDFGDFPSLGRFNSPLHAEGLRYEDDLAAFHEAMEALLTPIHKAAGYKPRYEFIEGNHEGHIERWVNENPTMEGKVSIADLKLSAYGWRVHPFLQPVGIGGVAFCHYFPSGVMGRPITSAKALMAKLHMSAIAGHQQGRDIAFGRRADGADMTAIISGSFYQHTYKYLSPFTNTHWRGMWFLHQVKDGQFDEMALSIDYLLRRFGR
jgi:hypothetical protein